MDKSITTEQAILLNILAQQNIQSEMLLSILSDGEDEAMFKDFSARYSSDVSKEVERLIGVYF